ncbi:MAG: C-terminal binding protein [Planctomycetaceae bacterium]|nr:C-terminal binding protein [Planctomycetaceae bacterium]
MPRVLLTDYAWPDLDIERAILAEVNAELIVAPDGHEPTLIELAHNVDAIMTCWARVTRPVIDASDQLRVISRLGIGLDNIDVAHASTRAVIVVNVPDYCLDEVAEHALALIFALARKVAFYHGATKHGRYNLKAGLPLWRIKGKTLGIVGLGQIGQCLATKAAALGMRVVACGRTPKSVPGVEWCSFDEVLGQSDFISLHVPATPETQHLMGAAQFARMKPAAFLINTSRGALVDEAALATALQQGQLAGAALDVQQQEPTDLKQPPMNDPRVIVTPHAAFMSVESLVDLRTRATRQVVDALQGQRPPHVVNPEGYTSRAE